MKRILLIVTFICACTTVVVGQEDHSQVLINLLMQDDYFHALSYKQQYNESIAEEVDLFYKYKMNEVFNKPDSAAIYLEQLLKQYPTFLPHEALNLEFLNVLIGLYGETQNYEKQVATYDRAELLIINEPFSDNSDSWKTEQLALLNNFRSEAKKKLHAPKIKVLKKRSDVEAKVDIQSDSFIRASVECNGVSLQPVIDTGLACHLFVSKEIADKCHFKEITSPTDSLPMNGVMVRAHWAMAKSIRMGEILFTNIPVFVLHDKVSSMIPKNELSEEQLVKFDSIMSICDAVVGLPLLQKLGSMELDFKKNEMTLKAKSEVPSIKQDPNLYIKYGKLYTHLLINDIEYKGIVDTRAHNTFIDLNQQFYEKNRGNLPIEQSNKERRSLTIGLSVTGTTKTGYLLNPKVMFNLKNVELGGHDVIVVSNDNPSASMISNDGDIGNLFLKQLGTKVKFDFVNMRMVAE